VRVVFDILQQRIAFHASKPGVALGLRALQPLESQIRLAAKGVNLGNLKCRMFFVLGDELRQGRVGFFLARLADDKWTAER
jgi:hypothetical protein